MLGTKAQDSESVSKVEVETFARGWYSGSYALVQKLQPRKVTNRTLLTSFSGFVI